jgi:hypothetical protein
MDKEIKKKFKDTVTLEYDELNTKSIVLLLKDKYLNTKP